MSPPSRVHRRLRHWYEHYVGEPDSQRPGVASRPTVLGVLALVLVAGTAVVGIASAGALSPAIWQNQRTGLNAGLLATGLLLVAGLTAIGLVLAGRKDVDAGEPVATDELTIPSDGAAERVHFALRPDESGGWTWRVLHLKALAESSERTPTRSAAAERVERLQSTIATAGLLELPESAIRLSEDREGTWEWTLVREDGSPVGASPRPLETRDEAADAASFLKDRAPGADVVDIEGAAFAETERRDGWHWRLFDDERTPLAASEDGYASRDRAGAAAETFAERIDRAPVLDVEDVGVELYERGHDWAWRFVDDADEVVADSIAAFPSRRAAETAADAVRTDLASAPLTVAGEPALERYRIDGEWRWRLVDERERTVAHSFGGIAARDRTARDAELFSSHARDAEIVDIGEAAYEVYPTQDSDATATAGERNGSGAGTDEGETRDAASGWRWRLVTENREVIAASTDARPDAETARDAIERVREQASDAELIEFENAAFRVYEGDAGEWRWRLVDEDGTVLADSGEEHASRSEAAEAMLTLKEQAPDADVLEMETAAFELFVTDDGEWGWRLIDSAGALVAEDPDTHPSRDAARRAMDRLLEYLDADVRTMDRAIFQAYAADDWHWRFVLPTGRTVAVTGIAYPTRDELVDALDDVREAAATARDYSIGAFVAQLYGDGDWSWRLLDRDRTPIADSPITYPDRDAALTAVEALRETVANAPLFAIEDAAVRLVEGDEWRWELVTRDREVLASAVDTAATKADAIAEIEAVRRLAPVAGTVDVGVASFDLVADADADANGGWRWRFLDTDGRPVAIGAERHDSKAAAREALDDVRRLIECASVLEITSTTFELHAVDDEWVWRLVDEYGDQIVESTRTYETRTDAREAINDVKAHAAEGEITRPE